MTAPAVELIVIDFGRQTVRVLRIGAADAPRALELLAELAAVLGAATAAPPRLSASPGGSRPRRGRNGPRPPLELHRGGQP